MKEESITLYFKQGSSDKLYQVKLKPNADGWVVDFQYGRRGKPLRVGTKTKNPVAYDVAKKAYDKLVASKMAKGYTPDGSGTAFSGTEKVGRISGFLPQLLNPIEKKDIKRIMATTDIAMQIKHDGERRPVLFTPKRVIAVNRKGLEVALPDNILFDLHQLREHLPDLTLDTEDMGDHLVIFDVIVDPNETFRKRCKHLAKVSQTILRLGLHTLKADIPYYPADLMDAIEYTLRQELNGEEGVVLRDLSANYSPGRPASGGPCLKLKFYATATVEVMDVHPTKRSIRMGMYDTDQQGQLISVGNCTIPANKEIPGVGALVEIKYLYAYRHGSLYQPQYLYKRTDLDSTAAAMHQLKYKETDA